jgi:mycothiol system anti-sigma-R factor
VSGNGAGVPGETPGALNCDQVMAQLYRYIDQDMSWEDLERMQAHLDVCLDCVYEMDAVDRLRRLLRRSCVERAPDELRRRVAARLAEMRDQLAASTS